MNREYKNINQQCGAVLVISMIFLVVLTLLGISAMRTTVLEEKMAGNYKSCQIAFQSAEAAMRAGEVWLQSQTARPNTSTANQTGSNVWLLNAPLPLDPAVKPNWWDDADNSWWTTATYATEYADSMQGIAANPRYVREEQTYLKDSLNVGIKGDSSGRVFYRVTARGVGATGQTSSILQSTYTRRF